MVTLRARKPKKEEEKKPAAKKKTHPDKSKSPAAKKRDTARKNSSTDSPTILDEFLTTFAADHKSKHNDITILHNLITEVAPSLQPELQGKSTLAYGGFDYQTKSKCAGRWARLVIMVNKTGLSLMVSGEKDGKYLLEGYDKKHFGKASVGKSCIRFSKLEDLNMDRIRELIAAAKDADVSSIAV